MKQVCSLEQYYDEIMYQRMFITKIVVLGRIKEVIKTVSPRNIPIIKVKIDDGTTSWR